MPLTEREQHSMVVSITTHVNTIATAAKTYRLSSVALIDAHGAFRNALKHFEQSRENYRAVAGALDTEVESKAEVPKEIVDLARTFDASERLG